MGAGPSARRPTFKHLNNFQCLILSCSVSASFQHEDLRIEEITRNRKTVSQPSDNMTGYLLILKGIGKYLDYRS